jgi:uncharacterized membrane protein
MEDPKTCIPLDELKKLRRPLRNVNTELRESLTYLERIALWITERIGTMGFFFIIFIWTIFWLAWNTFAPVELRFDPLPAFVLWLFISNMIQILLMPLIMVGQNLQGRHAEKRANADYEVNMQSGREIETILQHLENLNERVEKLGRRLGDVEKS